ncbi:MAG: chemotaxis protein CheW [Treponema sp.]|nr:chemotaxis protein CheW [Treponema sp.]
MSENAETVGNADEKYLIFSILGRLYTFPTRIIGEIAVFDAVYPLPLMPPYVPGVINRYSVPYALFDIGLLLFDTPSPRGKVLVLKESIDRIAFLIDDVSGIADVPRDRLLEIERGPESDDVTETVSASFDWDGSNVLVLDVNRILSRVADVAV